MEALTLNQFKSLPTCEQLRILKDEAILVGGFVENKWSAFLYQLHSFYVEVYHNLKVANITEIRIYTSIDHLERYLSKTDLSELGF
jgi:hypothetical protein